MDTSAFALVDTSGNRPPLSGDRHLAGQEGSEVSSTAHQGPAEDLRLHLRAATMAAHDLLDHSMQAASGWQNLADYARFLSLQHAARAPVEAWLEDHAPVDLRPPAQTPLIARDLAMLGLGLPEPAARFGMAEEHEGEALGAAWVLAGSALGNKAILKQMRRASAAEGSEWPATFLSDEAMLTFWQNLRTRIERPASAAQARAASEAASAVFAHFTAHAQHAGGLAA
ncbi:MAG: biliverdin-producing heme oxygenase [Erythrobacter sp.]